MATTVKVGIGAAEAFANATAPSRPWFFRSLMGQSGRGRGPAAMPFTIVPVPGNGMGLVATKPIRKDSIILSELAVLHARGEIDPHGRGTMLNFTDILAQFRQLDKRVSSEIMDLHLAPKPHLIAAVRPAIAARCRRPDGSALADQDVDYLVDMFGKFQTNAFALDMPGKVQVNGLFLLSSRINHSCIPNARRETRAVPPSIEIIATRDIPVGEEITISYMPIAGQTVEQRRETTRRIWDFTCICPACSSGDKILEDETAQSVAKVREALLRFGIDVAGGGMLNLPGGVCMMMPSVKK